MQILTTGNDGGYYEVDGTSGAAALVSGAVALLRAKYPDEKAADIVHRLTATATDAGPKGRDDTFGYGRLNLVRALTADVAPLPSPTPSSTAPSAAPQVTDASGGSGNSGMIIMVGAFAALLVGAVIVAGVVN